MASSKTTGLAKRFRPFLDQANTEAALRYGGQEAAFGTILGQLTKDRERQLQAQATANSTLLGSLDQSDRNVNRYYSDAGLSPTVLSSLAGSPTGQRLAGEMASYRAANQQGLLGAQAGNQFQVGKINDQFGDNFSQLGSQLTAEQKERGLFTSSTLEQLIKGDRDARHKANAEARKTAHADAQAILDRAATAGNALIGQGITPVIDADGNVTLGDPIPGGQADPNAPKNKPKRTTGPGTATREAQLAAGTAFKAAVTLAKGMNPDEAHADRVLALLTRGAPASKGKAIYVTVPVLDARGEPRKDSNGKPITKQVKAVWKNGDRDAAGKPIDKSLIGTVKTTADRPELPKFDAPIAAAATEMAIHGYVSTATVRDLQTLGYSVNQIPGLKTEHQYKQAAAAAERRSHRVVTRPTQAVPGLGALG